MTRRLAPRLRRVAELLKPELPRLNKRLRLGWRAHGLDLKRQKALAAVNSAAAAALLAEGRSLADFLEQVDYHGRRLAKLDVSLSHAARAIQSAGRLMEERLRRLVPEHAPELEWARRQLDLAALLVLHHAYYCVREAEAGAFQELFRAELEARDHRDLIARCVGILARWSRADAARLYLRGAGGQVWAAGAWPEQDGGGALTLGVHLERRLRRPRLILTARQGAELILAAQWRQLYATCWSVPLVEARRIKGVLQLGFRKQYEWLPAELRVLRLASELILAASEKARLAEDLLARERQIRRLAEQMVHVEEAERRRISQELHDEAGQSLLCLRLRLEMLEQEAAGGPDGLRAALAEARRMAERSVEEIRRVVADLSPAVLEHLGLEASVRRLVSRFRRTYGIKVRSSVGVDHRVPKRLERVVYRLVQECLNNAGKHSRARHLNLCLQSDDKGLRLRVEDDGIGFRVAEVLAGPRGFGLPGMQERVELLGGRWRIDSAPGRGTRILIELPIPEAAEPRCRQRGS